MGGNPIDFNAKTPRRKGASEFLSEASLWLEHLKKYYSHAVKRNERAVFFAFWLRFGSVTGLCRHAPSPKPRQNAKIPAPHGYSISLNALISAVRTLKKMLNVV
jgi:hypothetical protein